LLAPQPSSPQFTGVSLRTPTQASGPQHITYHPRLLKWWGFIVWDLLFGF
jgi:hypothetical protein